MTRPSKTTISGSVCKIPFASTMSTSFVWTTRSDVMPVLNPVSHTEISVAMCRAHIQRRLKAVERHAVRAVTDAVKCDLKSFLRALDDHPCQLFGRHARDAAVVRVVRKGREHGRG